MKIRLFFIFFFYILGISAQDKLVLFFDFNQDFINQKSKVEFNKWLENSKDKEILKIIGYCDSIDSNKYNDELSLCRANNVLTLLEFNKVQISEKCELTGLGEDFEQAENRSENRKVVLYYQLKALQNSSDQKKSEAQSLTAKTDQDKKGLLTEAENQSALIEKINNAKVGDLIQLENLNFYLNSEKIMAESQSILSDLLQVLRTNPRLKINIHGHICCNNNPNDVRLSFRRSKFVFDYLIRNGISTSRLGHRGFGSNRPIYKLPEKNEAERIANRRVEILVVKK
jgi:outer membrane protein OmpA-like peptidoglycan-associated protein